MRSRIYQALVVKSGVASSAGAYFDGSKLDASAFTVYGAPRGTAKLDEVQAAIDAEIAAIVKDGVTEKELESARNRFLRSMIFARDNQASMANLYGIDAGDRQHRQGHRGMARQDQEGDDRRRQSGCREISLRRPFGHRLPASFRPGAELT